MESKNIKISAATTAVLLITSLSSASAATKIEKIGGVPVLPPHNRPVCLLTTLLPPSHFEYIEIGRIVATKRTYGSNDELIVPMANEARKAGADAIINLDLRQRFKGPLPWRITSPTGVGMAIKLVSSAEKFDCVALGGMLSPTANEAPATAESGEAAGTSTSKSAPKLPPPAEPSSSSDTTESLTARKLRELNQLLESGLITETEYKEKRAAILSAM